MWYVEPRWLSQQTSCLVVVHTPETVKLVIDWRGDFCDRPATPEMIAPWCERVRQRLCIRRSEIIEAEEAQLRMTRASTDEPSGASTNVRHIMSKKLEFSPVAAWDGMDSTAELCVNVWGFSLASKCSSVQWDFWHFLQQWRDFTLLDKVTRFQAIQGSCIDCLSSETQSGDHFIMCHWFEYFGHGGPLGERSLCLWRSFAVISNRCLGSLCANFTNSRSSGGVAPQ